MGYLKNKMIEKYEDSLWDPARDLIEEHEALCRRLVEEAEDLWGRFERLSDRLESYMQLRDELDLEDKHEELEEINEEIHLAMENLLEFVNDVESGKDTHHWESEQMDAVAQDDDEYLRFGIGETFGMRPHCRELMERIQFEIDAVKGSGKDVMDKALALFKLHEERINVVKLATVRVYRLLRPDETAEDGIYQKIGYDPNITATQHIEQGCYGIRSRFISTSRILETCLFFANKGREITFEEITSESITTEMIRIAVIDLRLDDQFVHDLSESGSESLNRLEALEIEPYSRAHNYARAFEEVLVERKIETEEVVQVLSLHNIELPNQRTFSNFQQYLDPELVPSINDEIEA